MYSTEGFENVFDLMAYTVKAMKDVGRMIGDIEDYVSDSIKNCNLHIIALSKDMLDGCNEILKTNTDDFDFDTTWRDHYYSSLWDEWDDDKDDSCSSTNHKYYWDDDGRYENDVWDEDDSYSARNKQFWEDDNAVDDVETEDELEAYEGFSSCKRRYWDCTDSEELDDLYDKHGVMYDPWDDVDDKLS